ncbi:MAG: Flp family type IVb pilin [Beijerinckiaceae bacterium]
MSNSLILFRHFCKDDSGATAIEYALIAAIVCMGIILSLTQMTNNLKTLFNNVNDGFKAS